MTLSEDQITAIHQMKNGCILNGDTGSGKTLTSLGYYYLRMGGSESFLRGGDYKEMDRDTIKDLYIITTARKRDTEDWEKEMVYYALSPRDMENQLYYNKIVVDSWNNIKKYQDVKDSFFIFDEDRVTGNGVWVKSFLKIAKHNEWIILSATPGDTWMDYIPVFVANGFYRNKTEFIDEHVIYSRYTKYPKVDRYINVRRLIRLRDSILIDIAFQRKTEQHHITVECQYDIPTYNRVMLTRKDPVTGFPLRDAGELCRVLRKLTNSDPSRADAILKIMKDHNRLIIFYNYDFELEILRHIYYGPGVEIAEWNGHQHQPIPFGNKWVYLVQYTAGAEGWNCITTDTILFYSQTYSYKVLHQSCGRIDRRNTAYKDLYYYHLKSKAPIDRAIERALTQKKKFNEGGFIKW